MSDKNKLFIIYDQFSQRIISHHQTKTEAYGILDNMGNEFKKFGSKHIPRFVVREF